MESLDSILASLQQKYQEPNPSDRPAPVEAVNPDIKKDGADLDLDYLNLPDTKPNSIDRLLADLRQTAPLANTETIQVSTRQECTKQISHAAIVADLQQFLAQQSTKEQQAKSEAAQKWLKDLDPLSGEGLWFAEFAKNYDSHLEAAIALLSS